MFYDRVFDELKKYGIEPIVTILLYELIYPLLKGSGRTQGKTQGAKQESS